MRPPLKSSTSVLPRSYDIPCHLKSQSLSKRCRSTSRSCCKLNSNGVIRAKYLALTPSYISTHCPYTHTSYLPALKRRIYGHFPHRSRLLSSGDLKAYCLSLGSSSSACAGPAIRQARPPTRSLAPTGLAAGEAFRSRDALR